MKNFFPVYIILLLLLLLSSEQSLAQENCNNGIDDDGDGLIDCQDTENCGSNIVCTFEFNCSDGIDNDNDGDVDCNDSDCPACTTEICGDGIDNDGDGLIDCQDPDSTCPTSSFCESDCGDGIDNDGDGFYDYYDGDCQSDPNNPNTYIINQPDCEAQPRGNTFSIQAADSSANETSAAMGMPMVADVDNDGTPEIITTNHENGNIFILSGDDLSIIENQTDHGSNTFAYPTVGDVDGDGYGEIFISDRDGKIVSYQHDLTVNWTENSTFSDYGRVMGLADFNLDGTPELYQVNEIRDATTGAILVAGSHGTTTYPSANNWENELNSSSVAIDILPDAYCADCDGLELVVGHIIYSVDIDGMRLTEVLNMNDAASLPAEYQSGEYYPKKTKWGGQNYSTTSVVDYNQDGHLDIILGGTTGSSTGPSSVFFWDIHNSEVKMFVISRPGNTINATIRGNFRDLSFNSCDDTNEECTWINGVGTLNIANIDDDPELEITFMSGSSLYALNQNMNIEWANHDDFWESSSGFTGTTVFDFDGDGASEVIYRDEVNLYIVKGTDGSIASGLLDGSYCSSQTQGEYPIVADVDGDGETEIVVSCGMDMNSYGSSPNTSDNRKDGHIKVYKASEGNYWVPAREIWNQFSYFNVNINDNLSIPRIPQPHHISLSQLCGGSGSSASFSLNKFLNQSPRISYCGNLVFPAAKLDFVADSFNIHPPQCPDQEFQIRLYFENNGDLPVTKSIPIAFYSEDPQQAYSDSQTNPNFEVVYFTIAGGLQPGQAVDTTLTLSGPRGSYTLYASLNDIGPYDSFGNTIANSAFFPLTTLNGTVRECDNLPTIVAQEVSPYPFEVLPVKLSDNRNCPGIIGSNNGEVTVFAADSTVLPESEYNIIWTNIQTNDVVGTSATVSGLDSGTYQVEVVYDNGVFSCQGSTDTVIVERFEDWPDTELVTIETIQPVSSCNPGTSDGIARVLVNGTNPSKTDYKIEWEDEQQAGVLVVGDTATNLKPILYKVTVTNLLTGCAESKTIDMTLDLPVIESVTATDNTNCKNPNGTITVKMVGNSAKYDYTIIQQSPVQDTLFSKNPSFTDLDEGIYEVRAYDPTNECGLFSTGETVELYTSKTIEDITIRVAKEQTACSFPYNGQLTAELANASHLSKYDWVWYRGTVTGGPTAEVVARDYITPDTLSTNITATYTVVATESSSGCKFSESIVLGENITPPTITASNLTIIQHQTTCEPNGQIQISAGSPASTTGYIFTLKQGSTVIASNYTGLFTDLEAGPYIATAEDTATRCVSNPSEIFYIENQIAPFPAITVNETPQTNCNLANPNGGLALSISGSGSHYQFKWFIGVDTATAVNPQPATPELLSGIAAGNYVLSIYNSSTGCDTLVYANVSDLSADYQETITANVLQHQIYCTPGVFSGEIEAGLTSSVSGDTPDVNNYTFYWYQGTKNQVRNGSATLISGEDQYQISNRNEGWYSVRAMRSDGFGCTALDTAEVYIENRQDFPVADVNVTIVEQSSCDSNDPNGELVGNVGGNVVDYTFTWYELIGGIDREINTTNYPDVEFTDSSIKGLGVGTYVLEVAHKITGCSARKQVYLQDNIIKGSEIRLTLNSSAATICSTPNGVAEVISIDLSEDDGITYTIADDPANYNYQWYLGSDTTTRVVSPTAATSRLENAEPGLYTVVATNIHSDCASVSYTIEIENELEDQLSFTIEGEQETDCLNPNGSISVKDLAGGSGSYAFQWYKGEDDTYPLVGETGTTLTGIRSDKYMIRITDQATGCHVDGFYTLEADQDITPVPPAILTNPPKPSTTCDPGIFDGEIIAEVDPGVRLLPNFMTHTDNDFFYYWFEGDKVKYKDAGATPIDDISNLDVFRNDPPSIGNNKSTISGLAPGYYTVIVVDALDHVSSGGTLPLGCRSDPRTFEVIADAKKPAISFTTKHDTLCVGNSGEVKLVINKRSSDNTTFTGFTLIDATQDGANFTPINYSESDDLLTQETNVLISELDNAKYTFTFQDKLTTCDTTITVDINDFSVAPVLVDNIQINSHQTSCDPPNGELEVISSTSTGLTDLSQFDFYWHNMKPETTSDITDPGKYVATGAILSGLDSGTYYLYAVDNITGCVSSSLQETILYKATATEIELEEIVHITDCSGTAQGSINLSAHDLDYLGNQTTPANGYDFNWYDSDGNSLPIVDVTSTSTTSKVVNLVDGEYTVEVLNRDLKCVLATAVFSVLDQPVLPEFTSASVSKKNVTICKGDGEIRITQIYEDGITINESDPSFANYSFRWHQSSPAAAPLSETANSLVGLDVDTYYVYIVNNSTGGCISEDYLQITLSDSIRYPVIYKTGQTDFITCTNLNEGEITISVEEWDGSTSSTGYSFNWTLGDNSPLSGDEVVSTSPALNSTSSTLSNLIPGSYRVEVVNNDTGCPQTAFFDIKSKTILPILSAAKLNDLTNCSPANGAAEITEVLFNGSPVAHGDYQFHWFAGDFSNPMSSSSGYGLTADSLSANQLPTDTYFVKAVHRVSGCESYPVQIEIEDSTQTFHVVLDNISDPIVACDPFDNPEGSVEISVLDDGMYDIRWYEGPTIMNDADSLIGYTNSLVLDNMIPGSYTVRVMDTETGCATTRTYTIDGIGVPITVSTSSLPFTSCISPDGQAVANANGGSGSYVYQWYDSNGGLISTADDRNLLSNLESGVYSVQVTDRFELDCESAVAEVVISNSQGNNLQVDVSNDFSVTNCDESRPNGQLSATIMGDESRYDFFWYEGKSINNSPIAQGATASNLAPGTYAVTVRDKITGCLSAPHIGEVLSSVDDYFLPTPKAVLIAPVTRCSNPDGSVMAVIDSTLQDSTAVYEYNWYNEKGKLIFRSSRTNVASGLASGTYEVLVTNLVTGCYSTTASVSVPEEIYTPDFDIVTTPSSCMEPTGSAYLKFYENMNVVRIEWLTPTGYNDNLYLSNQYPGLYEVTITNDKGCTFTRSAQIESAIHTYNGVSPNGDGNNDKFLISCIEDFTNNIVRIYNRAGALVYENLNYDNHTSYFEGIGNKGLYIGGEKLPDGTYYYIIDKNNGDEPQSGYLELIR